MMWRSSKPRFDVATAIDRGGRDYQEDSLVSDFPVGENCGIGVLADGMGGHCAGDVASNIVVTEVFAELKFRRPSFIEDENDVPMLLRGAVESANHSLHSHVKTQPDSRGMGSTLVATVMVGPNLYWASVGDSPLFIVRGGELRRLNEDHSMAPQIDAMVASGQLSQEAGMRHPDRNCLTSAIFGMAVPRVDCPVEPFQMQAGDILIISSDGLQFLSDEAIARIVYRNRRKPAGTIANALLEAVTGLDDPDQDNISLMVIKVSSDRPVTRPTVYGRGKEAHSSRLVLDADEVEEIPETTQGSEPRVATR